MNNLIIRQLLDKNLVPWNLLLMADPSRKIVQKYLDKGEIYIALLENKIIGEYILMKISKDVVELKNIAVDEKYQNQGIGKLLALDAISRAKAIKAKRIEVGTGNSSLGQLDFYKKCGFKTIGIDKGFFTRNYKEEIIENGIKCTNMIRLAVNL
jgi:N-acetylglutamate synthase-like GNAT family acetyltransferase